MPGNPASLEAFRQLLAQPDPRDLPRRGHTLRWEGEPDRRSTRLLPLVMGWLQQRFLETEVEEPLVPAIRTFKRPARVMASGLRLVRPTARVNRLRRSPAADTFEMTRQEM